MAEETNLDNEGNNEAEGDVKEKDTILGSDEQNEDGEGAEKKAASENEGSDDGKSKDGEDTDKDKNEGAPEAYEEFSLPEGMEVDKELYDKATEVFKDFDLTQDQAQQLVDMQVAQIQREVDKLQESWNNTLKEWEKSSKDDKEFGGREFDQNVTVAKEAMEEFGTPEFTEMLEETGVGNHPEMIRFLYRVGKVVSEDKILKGSKGSSSVNPADVLYPTMKDKS